MRLIIVEDNQRLGRLMRDALQRAGFVCDLVMSLAAADAALAVAEPDGLILDLALPDGDGLDWLIARRRAGFGGATLILTARDGLEDRVDGLDAGADDYVVKPVEMAELAARLRALLRRPGPRAAPRVIVGSVMLDTAGRQAFVCDHPLALTRREIALLEALMRRAGGVVPRAVLEDALYGFDEPVTPNALEALMSRLRRKLDEHGAGRLIHTVRGIGYMMVEP